MLALPGLTSHKQELGGLHEECGMDREPLGWTVKRHVVDVTLDEVDRPRSARAERYVAVGQAAFGEVRGASADAVSITSGARAQAPSPAP